MISHHKRGDGIRRRVSDRVGVPNRRLLLKVFKVILIQKDTDVTIELFASGIPKGFVAQSLKELDINLLGPRAHTPPVIRLEKLFQIDLLVDKLGVSSTNATDSVFTELVESILNTHRL
jgi:hypothetical protein